MAELDSLSLQRGEVLEITGVTHTCLPTKAVFTNLEVWGLQFGFQKVHELPNIVYSMCVGVHKCVCVCLWAGNAFKVFVMLLERQSTENIECWAQTH